MHFVDDHYFLCERGLGQALSTMLGQQAFALTGGRSKRIDASVGLYRELLAAIEKAWDLTMESPDGSYLRSSLKDYEILAEGTFEEARR